MKKPIILLVILVLVLFLTSGCSTPSTTTTTTETTSSTASVTSTSELSPTPTETEVNADFALAPEIDGLTKQIQDNKVVYVAKEGNIYGIKTSEICGYFSPETYLDGEKVGGICLSSAIVESMISAKLANNESDCIPIPVDPNDDQKIEIKFSQTSEFNPNFNYGIFYISTDKPVNVTSPFFNVDGELEKVKSMNTSQDNGKTLFSLIVNYKLFGESAGEIGPENQFDRLFIFEVKDSDFEINSNVFNVILEGQVQMGDVLAVLNSGTFSLQKGSLKPTDKMTENDYTAMNLSESELLKIGECLVFIQSN